MLLPRPGAIIGGSIYFWGGVTYAVVLNRHFSIADVAIAWFCIEFIINQAKYWLNDYRDVASDRLHPRKKERASVSECFLVKWLLLLSAARIVAGMLFCFGAGRRRSPLLYF